jgi:hypothetical protein
MSEQDQQRITGIPEQLRPVFGGWRILDQQNPGLRLRESGRQQFRRIPAAARLDQGWRAQQTEGRVGVERLLQPLRPGPAVAGRLPEALAEHTERQGTSRLVPEHQPGVVAQVRGHRASCMVECYILTLALGQRDSRSGPREGALERT